MRRFSLLVLAVYYLASLTNAQVSEGQTFPGGVIISINPGATPTPAPPAPIPPPEDDGVDEGEEEIDEEEQALQQAIEALCAARVDREAWNAAEMEKFTRDAASVFQDGDTSGGWQNFLINRVDSVAASSYTCGADSSCELATLDRVCSDDPRTITLLRSLANLSNFVQTLRRHVNEQSAFFQSKTASMPDLFNPDEMKVDNSGLENLQLGLAAANSFIALVPQLAPVSTALDIIGALLPFFEEEEPEDDTFNQFANISASAGAVTKATIDSLRAFVRGSLNSESPVGSVANMVALGDFARPMDDDDDEEDTVAEEFFASLAAPGINRLWAEAGAVIIKASERSLGFDPCNGDTLFKRDEKRCVQGTMFVVRSLGRPQFGVSLQQKSPFDVPGLNNALAFGVTPQDVSNAADRVQSATSAFYGIPDQEETLGSIIDVNRIRSDLVDSLLFNLPVCDMDSVSLLERQERICEGRRFEDAREMCRFNLLMNCACPNLQVGGEEWPFRTGDDVNCNVESPR